MPPASKKQSNGRKKYTARDWIDFEEATGLLVSALNFVKLPMKAAAGIVWMYERLDNADLTFDEVLEYSDKEISDKMPKASELINRGNPTKGD